MNKCSACGRVGGCGCLWESKTLCKKCGLAARGEAMPLDLKMELEAENNEKTSVAAVPAVAEMVPVSEATPRKMVHHGFSNPETDAWLRRYCQSYGISFFWNGLKDNFFKSGQSVKHASIVAIWNGHQFTTPLSAKLCRVREIPHFFFELGMLPQSETYLIDPKGFCGDSILNGDLSWVTEEDMQKMYRKREELQALYPLDPQGNVLAPLQIHNDSQVLFYSRYTDMDQFIADVESRYPDHEIIARPHPKGGKSHQFKRAKEVFEGDFLSNAAKASLVVGITSTTLYESVVLGVPVVAFGNHPLATHPPELHNRVAAGALALTVRRDGDLRPILERFGIEPLK